MDEGKRTIFAFTCIGLGLIMGIVGSLVGTKLESSGNDPG
jgi:hypothetical protein